MKHIIDRINSYLVDASNDFGDIDSDEHDTRAAELAVQFEAAIDAAMAIGVELSQYLETDHEQAASDHDWDQRIDEARGK